ncbi:MAG: hypothetical protein Tsb0034_13390 [Ekhidna sp.]
MNTKQHRMKYITIGLVFTFFCGANLYGVLFGKEAFPFSNNPMFGHYVTTEDTLATLTFVIESEGRMSDLSFKDIGLWEVRTLRYYFSHVYGSSEPNSPQSDHISNEDFIMKNAEFFKGISTYLKNREINHDRISLAIDFFTSDGRFKRRRIVGSYLANDENFVMR